MIIIPEPCLFDGTSTPAIYAIYHKPTGRIYIGSAIDISKRWACHRSHLKKGIHNNGYLQRTHDKYGIESFEFRVIEPVPDPLNLITREQYWIDKADACNRAKGFNINPAAGSPLGRKSSDETKRKISIAGKGRIHSEETKRKIAQKAMGNRRGITNLRGHYALNAERVLIVFQEAANGKVSKCIGEQIGVTTATVNRVLQRVIWADVAIPQELIDALAARGSRRAKGDAHFRTKFTTAQVVEIKRRLALGHVGAQIARDVGCSHVNVSQIKRGIVYKHVGLPVE